MPETYPIEVGVGYGSEATYEPRVLRAKFGDGFAQTAGDGIQPFNEEYRFVYTDWPDEHLDTIEKFLRERNGVESFLWTPPGHDDATLWLQIGKVTRKPTGFKTGSMSFTVERIW